ncbi:MAG: rRNA maturation RNase YbeY [Candidatus Paceibacterota bacterium]|jgi:probable rRNA maturation factor
MNQFTVFSTQLKFKKYEQQVLALTKRVLFLLKKNNIAFDIFLVSKKQIKDLNKKFRGKNKETNVLSFCEPKNFVRPDKKAKYYGEIYLSLDFVKEKNQDLKLMVVHGILHLLGYDHVTKKDVLKMEGKESWLTNRL